MLYKFAIKSVLESHKTWKITARKWQNPRYNKTICSSIHDVGLYSTRKTQKRIKMHQLGLETKQIIQESWNKYKLLQEKWVSEVENGNGLNIAVSKHSVED